MSDSSVTGHHATNLIGVTPDSHQTEDSGVSQQHLTYLTELLFYPWQNKVKDAPNPGLYSTDPPAVKVKASNEPQVPPAPAPHGRPATNSAPWRGGRAGGRRRSLSCGARGRRARHVREPRGPSPGTATGNRRGNERAEAQKPRYF